MKQGRRKLADQSGIGTSYYHIVEKMAWWRQTRTDSLANHRIRELRKPGSAGRSPLVEVVIGIAVPTRSAQEHHPRYRSALVPGDEMEEMMQPILYVL